MTKKVFFPVVLKLNIPFNVLVILAVIIAMLAPASGSVASAQQSDHPWREVRTLDMDEYGLSDLEGMAFSPDANAFLLVQAGGSLAGIGMREEPVDTSGVELPSGDLKNLAYNERTEKLFALNSDDTQLAEIPMDKEGLPASGDVQEHDLDAVNLQSARGITFDPVSGQMFVLHADGDQMVIITPDANNSYEPAPGRVSRVNLSGLGALDLQSIAFSPQTGNIYLLDAADQRLYEINVSGDKLNEFDLSSLGMSDPKSMVFAPSVDQTDDPDNYNLVILHGDSVSTAKSTSSTADQIVELSLVAPKDLPPGTTILPAFLVRNQDLSNETWNPSSPDTSGIDWWPAEGRFLITDSEVEEEGYWQGFNVFSGTTAGVQGASCTTHTPSGGASWNHYTPEPTGLAINPNTNRIYIASDSGSKLFEINIGPDNEYCTSDDIVTTITIATDLEDVAYGDNKLFIGGGIDAEIFWFDLGANQVIGGGDDGPISNFDTARWGFTDVEGIGYNSDSGNILISGAQGGGKTYIAEVSTAGGGTVIKAYDVFPIMGNDNDLHSDIAYAPRSSNSSLKSVYIVSRGVDNGQDPNENDGQWWEINIGEATPVLTVSGITAANKVYNGTTAAIINTGSAALQGVTPGDDVTLVTTGATGAFVNANVGTNKTVNITGLTLSGADAGSYTLTQPTTTANITKAPLTVTAQNKTKTVAQPDPAFTFTYSGFVNAETGAVIDTPPTCTVSVPHTTPGTYPIVCSGGVDNNYSFTYVNGTLTVNPEITPGLGPDTTGVFRPSNGALYLKHKNTSGFADVQINYGQGGDYPVVGDWDGNGTATIGIYRNGTFYLRNSNTIGFADIVIPFGQPGDQPIAGDWNNDGIDTIGVYRSSSGAFLLRNQNTTGAPDMIFHLGSPGDVGIAGDWNGDGIDTTGVFRPSNGALYLKNTNATGFADIQINYGLPGDKPVTGDWDGDGDDTIGIYRNGQFMLRNSNTIGFADIVFGLGVAGDMPIAGNWDGKP